MMLRVARSVLFICVNTNDLAKKLADQFAADELDQVVGVGDSGYALAAKMDRSSGKLPMQTVVFDRRRELRQLESECRSYNAPPTLIDDLAVSGRTLEVALQYVAPLPLAIGVGMLDKRARLPAADVRAAMQYKMSGGRVPINSLATLQQFAYRREALAQRYFGPYALAFCQAVAAAEVAS